MPAVGKLGCLRGEREYLISHTGQWPQNYYREIRYRVKKYVCALNVYKENNTYKLISYRESLIQITNSIKCDNDKIFGNTFLPYAETDLSFIHARLFAFDANILKFIGGRRSRGCRGLPFESGNTLIHPCPFVWRNVYSLIHRDARRRLIYQIPKSRSSPRFPFSETRARRNVIPRRGAIQSLYRSDHVLQWVHLRHCDSRRAPDITCTLLDELRTMLLMEIYIHGLET